VVSGDGINEVDTASMPLWKRQVPRTHMIALLLHRELIQTHGPLGVVILLEYC